mmetsp:Transcript_70497/g.206281  ORF Transcript_70497/g.206281 Transcript_70497/m.206281 type:complete len:317 (-) Transcript_70497:680-1630(-)
MFPMVNLGRTGELLPGGGATTGAGASMGGPLMHIGEAPPEASADAVGLSRSGELPPGASRDCTVGLARRGEPLATAVKPDVRSIVDSCGLTRRGELVPCPALGVFTAAVTGVRLQEQNPSKSRSLRSLSFLSRSDICLAWSACQAWCVNRFRLSQSQCSCRRGCLSRESLKPTGTQTETPERATEVPLCSPSDSRPRSTPALSVRASSMRLSKEAHRSSMSASLALTSEAAASVLLRTCRTSWASCCNPSWVTFLKASTCSRSMSPWYADAAWSCSSSARVHAAHWPSNASRVRFSKSSSALTSSIAAICTLISCP